MQKKNQSVLKIEAVTPQTLVVGIDIAKHNHWARFIDFRGFEYGKAIEFKNNRNGFNTIIAKIEQICKEKDFNKVIVGMEPTGHYWKALANFLMKQKKIGVVLVNPYHTKKAKELDDNSPTKSDRKDSLTIARLVKDGRYFESYLPHDIYAELRILSNTRVNMNKRKKSIENVIIAVLDEYFPEFTDIFKCPFKGKVSMQILKVCPIPRMVLGKGESGILAEIKKVVKKSVGEKKALELVKVAKDSIGVDYGEYAAKYKIISMIEELELINKHLEEIGVEMERLLKETGISEYLLSIKGIGIVSASMCLGEIGDPLRFDDVRQLIRLAGYNLIEDSSGKSKSRTCISKRGRKNLRCILYQMSLVMVSRNEEMKVLYNYLKTRSKNPLKKKQALVVISKKILNLIFTLSKKKEKYDRSRVFGDVRKSQLGVA
jgi:transposase